MKKGKLIYAMLKRANNLEHSPSASRNNMNGQIAGLQFMFNEIDSIKEGIQNNSFHKNDMMFSFCNNVIVSTNLDIAETDVYEIDTDKGVFSLSKSALLRELTFTQKMISTLLKRQEAIQQMSKMPEDDRMATIKILLKEDKQKYTYPGFFAKEDVKALAKGRYLLAAHMAKPKAFDSCFDPNKNLNRFIHIFFSNVKKQQNLHVKDSNVIAEHIGVLSK